MRVLVACEFSGIVRDAFRARGHDAWSCDLLPCEGPGCYHIQLDARLVIEERGPWDLMIAHPECTRIANSGVRWLKVPPKGRTLAEMWAELESGCAFYRYLRDAPIPRKAIENPIMHCHARERIKPGPRQVVQPHWFGDPFFKATGFELINLPPLAKSQPLNPPKPGTDEHKQWSAVHRAPPGPNRWMDRSRSFPGMARQMAAQWGAVALTRPQRETEQEEGT